MPIQEQLYIKYSERPGTKASERLPDDIPFEVKKRRNNELLAVQTVLAKKTTRISLGETSKSWLKAQAKRPVRKTSNPANRFS